MIPKLAYECKQRFEQEFGHKSESLIAVAAPGRVNLIGEHTDYNNGFVFPMALPNSTVIVGMKTETNIINVFSIIMNEKISFSAYVRQFQYIS